MAVELHSGILEKGVHFLLTPSGKGYHVELCDLMTKIGVSLCSTTHNEKGPRKMLPNQVDGGRVTYILPSMVGIFLGSPPPGVLVNTLGTVVSLTTK